MNHQDRKKIVAEELKNRIGDEITAPELQKIYQEVYGLEISHGSVMYDLKSVTEERKRVVQNKKADGVVTFRLMTEDEWVNKHRSVLEGFHQR